MSEFVREASTVRGSWPTMGLSCQGEKKSDRYEVMFYANTAPVK